MPYKVCPQCNKKFFTHDKRQIYCSKSCYSLGYSKNHASNIANKNFINHEMLTNKELTQLLTDKHELIRKGLFARLQDRNMYDEAFQDVRIRFWLSLSTLSQYTDINTLEDRYLGAIVKNVARNINRKHVITGKDLRRLSNDIDIVSIETKVAETLSISDTLRDESPSMDTLIDTKGLVEKMLVTAIDDEDIQCAMIRAEEHDTKNRDSQKDRLDVVKNEYGIDVPNMREFQRKAFKGVKKLWSLYAPQLTEVLDLNTESFKFSADEVQRVHNELRNCAVCGCIFRPSKNNPRVETCSSECARILSNLKRNQKTKEKQRKQLLEEVENLRKQKEQLLQEIKNAKQPIKTTQWI